MSHPKQLPLQIPIREEILLECEEISRDKASQDIITIDQATGSQREQLVTMISRGTLMPRIQSCNLPLGIWER